MSDSTLCLRLSGPLVNADAEFWLARHFTIALPGGNSFNKHKYGRHSSKLKHAHEQKEGIHATLFMQRKPALCAVVSGTPIE